MGQSILTRFAVALTAALAVSAVPASTQIRTVDPSSSTVQANRASGSSYAEPDSEPVPVDEGPAMASTPSAPATGGTAAAAGSADATYREEEVLGKAEEVFGKGAEGLAKLIQNILKDQGQPNAYIAGREGGAAFIAGLRYGQGTLFHKVEGEKDAFWSGPSVGFDAGANGSKTFILVYNLYDSEDLFRRYPAAEGNLYAVGGFTASYLRRGDVVLVPIRLGVGWRFGANVGYMKFTHKGTVMPF